MKIPYLANRVFEIYIFTGIFGSILLAVYFCGIFNLSEFFDRFIMYGIFSLLGSVLTIPILYAGINHIFKKRGSLGETITNIYLCSLNICLVASLFILALMVQNFLNKGGIDHIVRIIPYSIPYIISHYIVIRYVNRKYDALSKFSYDKHKKPLDDILDEEL